MPEEVGATPQEGFSLDAVASALQQASEAAPDPVGPPENPTSPSGSETQAETANSPNSPAMVSINAQVVEASLQQPVEAEVVDSTPPASSTEAPKGTSSSKPTGQDPGPLEVECREALRTQWLTFPFQPEECAAATLARCRTEASMGSLDTLPVGQMEVSWISPSPWRRAFAQMSGGYLRRGQPSRQRVLWPLASGSPSRLKMACIASHASSALPAWSICLAIS